jgi:hypothetical protein
MDEVGADNLFLAVRHLPRAAHAKASWPRRWRSTSPASLTSRWPTTRAATSRARARSTTPSCSRTSTASATRASWAANTSRKRHRGRSRLAGHARRQLRQLRTGALNDHFESEIHMTTSPLKIGFIGLGIMGAPMALPPDQGRPPAVRHTRSKVHPEIAAEPATQCTTPRGVAERADIVFTMVPDTPDVEKRCCSARAAWPQASARARPWWT